MTEKYPRCNGNFIQSSDDADLVITSLREAIKNRFTKDLIFKSGIIGGNRQIVLPGSNVGTIKILPFIGYTQNGDRIEIPSTLDLLAPSSSGVINISGQNLANSENNVPIWRTFRYSVNDIRNSQTTQVSILIGKYPAKTKIHGIKLKVNNSFTGNGSDVYFSVGTSDNKEYLLPKSKVSGEVSSNDAVSINELMTFDEINSTQIYVTFYSNALLSLLSQGMVTIEICAATENTDELPQAEDETQLTINGSWVANTDYAIVARYKKQMSDLRILNITVNNFNLQDLDPFYARETDGYSLIALKKTGVSIQSNTTDDIQLGIVKVDSSGNISIYSNTIDLDNIYSTDFLKLQKYYIESNFELSEYFSNCILKYPKNSEMISFEQDSDTFSINYGSTVLIPNGKNNFGLFNTITYNILENISYTLEDSLDDGDYQIGLNYIDGEIIVVFIKDSKIINALTTPSNDYDYWYNVNTNLMKIRESVDTWATVNTVFIAKASIESNEIKSIQAFTPAQILTNQLIQEYINTIQALVDQFNNKLIENCKNITYATGTVQLVLEKLYNNYIINFQAIPSGAININSDALTLTVNKKIKFDLCLDMSNNSGPITSSSQVIFVDLPDGFSWSATKHFFSCESFDKITYYLKYQGSVGI